MLQPHFDNPTVEYEYLKYAGAIQGTTASKFMARNTRRYLHLHPSLKRVQTLEQFIIGERVNAIEAFEDRHCLPKSHTYSRRPADTHRAWENMLHNRSFVLSGSR